MVRILAITVCLATALLSPPIRAIAQETVPPVAAQAGDFFSGLIVTCTATELTVNRKGLGKDSAVTRTFAIDGNTKIEGALKPKAHVTVRFMATENGARAIHIIVR